MIELLLLAIFITQLVDLLVNLTNRAKLPPPPQDIKVDMEGQFKEEPSVITYPAPDAPEQYGPIRRPSAQDLEDRQKPDKLKETEQAISETWDDLLGDESYE